MLLIPILSLTAYFTISSFLFFFPLALHRRKKFVSNLLKKIQSLKGKSVLHIAHRGGAREALENSMEAISHAVASGTNIIELDVQFTKDKTIVLANDTNLGRLCGVEGIFSQRNYKDLPPLSLEICLEYSQETSFIREETSQNYFSTITETFLKYPNAFLMLDLKNATKELAIEINNLTKVNDRELLTIWGDSTGRVNLKKINPKIPTICPTFWMVMVFLAFPLGLLPFVPLNYEIFSWPLWNSEFKSTLKKSPVKYFFYLLFDSLSRPIFYHLRQRGLLVFQWVLNHDKEFNKAIQKGVNGIITDSPTELKRYLDKKQLYCSM